MKQQLLQLTIANFVQKTYDIINNNQHSKIIHWLTNGKQFTIKDIQEFQQFILPRYFRHRNINSFIRQLNMYGFHKSRKQPSKNIFSHPFFQKDKPQLLNYVRRKNKLDQKQPQSKTFLLNQSQQSIRNRNKIPIIKQQPTIQSTTSISLTSQLNFQHDQKHQIKGLISKSFIIDINPQILYLKQQSNTDLICLSNYQDNNDLNLIDQIQKQRQMFNRRTLGISIVNTSNFLQQLQF